MLVRIAVRRERRVEPEPVAVERVLVQLHSLALEGLELARDNLEVVLVHRVGFVRAEGCLVPGGEPTAEVLRDSVPHPSQVTGHVGRTPGDVLAERQVLDRVRHVDHVGVEVVSHGVRGDVERTGHAVDPEAAVDDASAGANLPTQRPRRPSHLRSLHPGRPSVRLAELVIVRRLGFGVGDGLHLVQCLEGVGGDILGGPHAVVGFKLELRRLDDGEVRARGVVARRRFL